MDFDLKPEIKKILTKINFIERYEDISNRFAAPENKGFDVPIERSIQIINSLGYDAVYDKKERFFKVGVVENMPTYRIWFNIVLRYNIAEFIWVVYHNNEVRLGSPWSIYSRLLVAPDKKIKYPHYSTSFELEQLLKAAFELYEDFKQEVIEEYQPIQTVLAGETPKPTP